MFMSLIFTALLWSIAVLMFVMFLVFMMFVMLIGDMGVVGVIAFPIGARIGSLVRVRVLRVSVVVRISVMIAFLRHS